MLGKTTCFALGLLAASTLAFATTAPRPVAPPPTPGIDAMVTAFYDGHGDAVAGPGYVLDADPKAQGLLLDTKPLRTAPLFVALTVQNIGDTDVEITRDSGGESLLAVTAGTTRTVFVSLGAAGEPRLHYKGNDKDGSKVAFLWSVKSLD
jgi:hypothetical protein